ncbi:acyl carrier protein [Bacillus cytotoxicus]
MVFLALKEVLEELGIREEEITENALLRKDLMLDSTETVQVSLEMKRKFDVNIKLESEQDFTIANIIEMVNEQMKEEVKN